MELLGIFNYGLVLVYGLFLSTHLSGGWNSQWQKRLTFTLCPLFLLIQIVCWFGWGLTVTMQIYPLIVHLPLVLILVLVLKKRVGISLVSVLIAYLCCQLPRWVKLMFSAITASSLISEISYTVSIVLFYLLLRRYFVRIANEAMSCSPQTLFLFGSLPLVYYVFEYTMLIGADVLETSLPALAEFFPTALIVFYVVFLVAYHIQMQKHSQAELQKTVLEVELRQSSVELENMRQMERQTAIYRHDLRHHLMAIDGLLSMEKTQQAQEYIRKVHTDLMDISVKCFCENELVNLLCSSFANKAEKEAVRLSVDVKLPKELSVPDTELCTILSNGVENAFHAVSRLEPTLKWIGLYADIRQGNLLIEIKNPYAGEIVLRDGLPASVRDGHGYGCRSICSIAEKNNGFCVFTAEQGLFTLRAVLPSHSGCGKTSG